VGRLPVRQASRFGSAFRFLINKMLELLVVILTPSRISHARSHLNARAKKKSRLPQSDVLTTQFIRQAQGGRKRGEDVKILSLFDENQTELGRNRTAIFRALLPLTPKREVSQYWICVLLSWLNSLRAGLGTNIHLLPCHFILFLAHRFSSVYLPNVFSFRLRTFGRFSRAAASERAAVSRDNLPTSSYSSSLTQEDR